MTTSTVPFAFIDFTNLRNMSGVDIVRALFALVRTPREYRRAVRLAKRSLPGQERQFADAMAEARTRVGARCR